MPRPFLALLIALSPAASFAGPKTIALEPTGPGGPPAPLSVPQGERDSFDLGRLPALEGALDGEGSSLPTVEPDLRRQAPAPLQPSLDQLQLRRDDLAIGVGHAEAKSPPLSGPAGMVQAKVDPGWSAGAFPSDPGRFPRGSARESLVQTGKSSERTSAPGAVLTGYSAGKETFDGAGAAAGVWSLEGIDPLPSSRVKLQQVIQEIEAELRAKGISRLPGFELARVTDLSQGEFRYDIESNMIHLPFNENNETLRGRAREEGQHAGDFLSGRLAFGDFSDAMARGMDYLDAQARLDKLLARLPGQRDPAEIKRARALVEALWRDYILTPVESTGRHARAYWELQRLKERQAGRRERVKSIELRFPRSYNRAYAMLMSGVKPEPWQRRLSRIFAMVRKTVALNHRRGRLEEAIRDLSLYSLFEEPAEEASAARGAGLPEWPRRMRMREALEGTRRLYGRSATPLSRLLEIGLRAWNRLRGRPARSQEAVFQSWESAWRRFGVDPLELRHTETSKIHAGIERITYIPGHDLWSVHVYEGPHAERFAANHRVIAEIAARWLPEIEIPEVFTYRRVDLSDQRGWREQSIAMLRVDEGRAPAMSAEHRLQHRLPLSQHWTRTADFAPAQLAQLAVLHLLFGVDGFHAQGLFSAGGRPHFAGVLSVLDPEPHPLDLDDARIMLTQGVAAYASSGPEFQAAAEAEAGRWRALAEDSGFARELRGVLARGGWSPQEADDYMGRFKAKAPHLSEDFKVLAQAYDDWRDAP